MGAGSFWTDSARRLAERDVVSPHELHQQLEKILASQTFAKSRRLQDLLRYTLERIHNSEGVKE